MINMFEPVSSIDLSLRGAPCFAFNLNHSCGLDLNHTFWTVVDWEREYLTLRAEARLGDVFFSKCDVLYSVCSASTSRVGLLI